MPKTAAWFLLAATVLLTVCAQLLIKWQVGLSGVSPSGPRGLVLLVGRLLLNPWIIMGLGSAFLASIAWMLTLSRLNLSDAYPFTAMSFVLILLASHALFGEPLTTAKILGTGLIVLGVGVLAMTGG